MLDSDKTWTPNTLNPPIPWMMQPSIAHSPLGLRATVSTGTVWIRSETTAWGL
uniref:Uncharacterized protein n=1 Tax=Anguilla anguilla TaxID=7936 RepID=A0A0E9RYW7_ANGAN